MSDHDVPSAEPSPEDPVSLPPLREIRFDFQPYHVLRVLAVAWAVAGLIAWPGIGCWVAAVVSAGADWYTHRNRIGWPTDVEDYLVERGWATRRPPSWPADERPPIPLRPMTVSELYGGACKILLRNWPTLVGIPAVFMLGFVAVLGLLTYNLDLPTPAQVGLQIFSGGENLFATLALTLVVLAAFYVVVLPVDAVLVLLGVEATDKVIAGKQVRIDEMLSRVTRRVWAVSRLGYAYYAILAAMVVFQVIARHSGFYPALIPLIVVCSIAAFVFGMLLTLSPIVSVLENRGVADSFIRSIQLCSPAAGRIIGIHTLWLVGMGLVALVSSVLTWVTVIITYPVLIGLISCVHMMIYTDLRIRQENYGPELLDEWMRNMGREGMASG